MFEDITKVVLLSDMDGTLLSSQKKITNEDLNAVSKFIALGGKFTVATGRTIQSFKPYTSMLDLRFPIIMYNGAAIYDFNTDEVLYTHPLPDETKSITREILEAVPQAGGEVLKTDGTYIFRRNDYEDLHTKLCRITPEYSDLEDIADGGWLKVLFAAAPEDIPMLEVFAKQNDYGSVDFVKSSEIFYEMLPKGVSKGSALFHYRNLSGMEDCTFVAVGDFDNDIEMLREADLGAAPANAQDSVKKSAGIVLKNSCDTGAVAELIEYIIEQCSLNH